MDESGNPTFSEVNTNDAMTWKLIQIHFLGACVQIANLRKAISDEFELSSQPSSVQHALTLSSPPVQQAAE